ncbi:MULTISPECIES: carbon-nitrogen hydrolase family protein [Halorussus]|uniref:carbon-nitrogen hydrolase family protein n=1 Tax=Halorussus TaxID=1070314 RepID=UPI0020A066A7|nr:carbon-nitrogen hydrolase family protein [Halorussus vallis]USZ75932.1 carbon-nitrogen hydrolase family protein [Halorussus vallis]
MPTDSPDAPAESFTVGAAQVEPVYHDKEATLDKTCRWIERAGREDVDLLVFPETYFPGYPYWRRKVSIPRWTELMVELQKNSLSVGDDALDVLGDAIRDANLHVALGTNELDDRPGSETLYNAIFFFDREGRLVRRHRKLMPTHGERSIWGRGDPSSLTTHETDLGTLGGLVCYENHMTLSKAALTAMGEEIHVAAWPGFWSQNDHPGDKSRAESAADRDTCDIYPAMREYAFETQSFVVSCSAYMGDPPAEYDEELGYDLGAGGSMLVNPAGVVKAGPAVGEETLLTAEFDRDERRAVKAYFDAMGHYSRWDAVNLELSDATLEPVHGHGHGGSGDGAHVGRGERASGATANGNRTEVDGLSPARAEELAEAHGVPISAVEDVAAALESGR